MLELTGRRVILPARTSNAAARAGRFFGRFRLDSTRRQAIVFVVTGRADSRRKHGEIDPLVLGRCRISGAAPTIIIAVPAIGPFATWLRAIAGGTLAIRPVATRFAVASRLAIASRARLLALRLFLVVVVVAVVAVAVIVHVRVQAIVAVIVLVVVAAPLLFIEPRTGIAQHAEIMVGKLQKIFGLDAIPGKLGITRHALVFLMQLGGIAALAVVAGIAAAVAGDAAGLLSAAATTAAALTIIDQSEFPRRTGASAPQNLSLEGISFTPMVRRATHAAGPLVGPCAQDRCETHGRFRRG